MLAGVTPSVLQSTPILKLAEPIQLKLSFAVMVTVDVAGGPDGVPLNRPLVGFKVIPVGRVPLVTEYSVKVDVPPAALIVAE